MEPIDAQVLATDPKLHQQHVEAQRQLIEERYRAFAEKTRRANEPGNGCVCASPFHLRQRMLYPLLASPDTFLLPLLGKAALRANGFGMRKVETVEGMVKALRLEDEKRKGQGPMLVMCSGLASRLTDHFVLLSQLAKRKVFSSLALIDIPGHDSSPESAAALSLATATQSLRHSVIALLEDQPEVASNGIVLLGLSMGARLVMELAAEEVAAPSLPRSLRGVVLVVPLGAPLSAVDQEKLATVYEVETYAQAKLITQQSGSLSDKGAELNVVANAATFVRMRAPGVRALIRSDVMTHPVSPEQVQAVASRFHFLCLCGAKDGVIPPETVDFFGHAYRAARRQEDDDLLKPSRGVKLVPGLTHDGFVFPGYAPALDAVVSFCLDL